MSPPRVCFVFRSKEGRGMGGAETSMLRMMKNAHPHLIDCQACFYGKPNNIFKERLEQAPIPVWIAKSFFEYYRKIQELGPEVIYLFARAPYLTLWSSIAKIAGIKCVVGAERGSASSSFDKISHLISNPFMDGFITNSHSAGLHLIHNGVDPKKVFVVYNGIDLEESLPSRDHNSGRIGNPLILCVANIQRQKGQIVLIRAVAGLRTQYPHARAVLVGRDYTKGAFFKTVNAKGFSADYVWVGSDNNVDEYMRQADVLVLPSLWGEGTPTAILEAMHFDLPVIASKTGGIPELIVDGETGTLVTPGNPQELAKAINQVLRDPEATQLKVRNAKELILQRHTMPAMIAGHIQAFHTFSGSQ